MEINNQNSENIVISNIGSVKQALRSTEPGVEVLTTADQIYDESLQARQSEINTGVVLKVAV